MKFRDGPLLNGAVHARAGLRSADGSARRGGLRSAESTPFANSRADFLLRDFSSPETSPVAWRARASARSNSLPALPAPAPAEQGVVQRFHAFVPSSAVGGGGGRRSMPSSRPGSKESREGAPVPMSALHKAEDYSRECARQGIVPVSLDVAAKIISKQISSKALVGDRQIAAWCSAGLFDGQTEIHLRDSQVGEEGAQVIAAKLGTTVQILDLTGNAVGARGAGALGRAALPRLRALSLSKNGLGDAAVQALCAGLQEGAAPQLIRLSLSENQISRAGNALGGMLGAQLRLNFLDLHWNFIAGDCALGLFQGVEANLANGGSLARLDLSWNCLGNGGAKAAMESLARALKAECSLVHLDLSYNSLRAEDCVVLAGGLRDNHTLVGLHLVGNSASVDADGFVIARDVGSASGMRPASVPAELLAQGDDACMPPRLITTEEKGAIRACFNSIDIDGSGTLEPEELETALNALDLQTTTEEATALIAKSHDSAKDCLDLEEFVALMESLMLQERAQEWEKNRLERLSMERDRSLLEARTSCWICESWQAVEITYVGEAHAVWALTSLDDYQKATPLQQEFGKWSCIRMMPPDQVCVVLQVDNNIRLVDGLQSATLKKPIEMRLRQAEGMAVAATAIVPVSEVSVLYLGSKKRGDDDDGGDSCKCIEGQPSVPKRAVVISDPDNPGGFCVKPRITETEFRARKQKATWVFEKSIFAAWKFEGTKLYANACGLDWQHGKVAKFLKEQEEQDEAAEACGAHYGPFIRLFRRCAANGSDGVTPGVSMITCAELLSSAGVIDEQYCRLADVDTMFIAARVREKGADKRPFAVKVADTLLRFQFMEFLLRVALARFLKTKEVASIAEAVRRLFRSFEETVSPLADNLQTFLKDLHTEACDNILRENEQMLGVVYRLNSGRWSKPAEERLMCCKEFEAVLIGIDCFNDAFPARDVRYVFSMGLQLYPDELYNLDFAQMTFLEFLHGIGAVAHLRREPGPLAERLGRLVVGLAAWSKVGGLLKSLKR